MRPKHIIIVLGTYTCSNKFDPIFDAITVVPGKSDSDVRFCLHSYQRLRIDRSLVYLSYPADRINTQVSYRFALAKVEYTS